MGLKSKNEIFDAISDIVSESLRIDKSRIESKSRLFDDLNAESIDILDIRFNIEQKFGVKINQEELINSLGDGLSVPQIQERLTISSLVEFIMKRINPAAPGR